MDADVEEEIMDLGKYYNHYLQGLHPVSITYGGVWMVKISSSQMKVKLSEKVFTKFLLLEIHLRNWSIVYAMIAGF